jgi:hypothetical protein
MKFRTAVLSLIALAILAAPPGSRQPAPAIDAGRYLDVVKHLAGPDLKGRGTGTPELEKAAQYLARQFERAGLKPAAGKSFLQPFQVTTNARLGKGNEFELAAGKERTRLAFTKDFLPFNFSASGSFAGAVVFAGYGITAKEYNYDDYADVDVKDKFVLILRHEPQEFDEKSVFAGKVYTEHSQFFSKASNAKMHGARGVILVNDTPNHGGDSSDELENFARTAGPRDAGIPFVQIKAALAEKLLAPSGKKLKDIVERIDASLKPDSFAIEGAEVRFHTDLRRDTRTVHNVVGYLAGETDEYVVIGAHYDHLGLGEQFSMAPSQAGAPHPGADDNASGTAGVVELARHFGPLYAGPPKPKRGILFQCYAGEELGLLGSSHYVNNPSLPLEKAVAMINMDMIGRIRDGKVYIGGVGTGSTFKALLEEEQKNSELKFEFSDTTGYGSSDHTSFTTKQVPVLFFFSGLHADYHKPSDTWDKIESGEAVKLLRSVASLTARLTGGAERPAYVRVAPPPANPHASGAPSGGGYGPYFGSIPDFAEPPTGVRFSDVREGSPAGKAGLKAGDILIEFDGKPVQNLYDFTYALRAKKVGETVRVKVLRGGKPLEADVLLEPRR